MSSKKDNANPTVLPVPSTTSSHKAVHLPEVAAALSVAPMATPSNHDNSLPHQRTPAERAVLQAMLDSAAATNGSSVSMLRNAGFELPTSIADKNVRLQQKEPLFVPMTSTTKPREIEKHQSGDTTCITADEIFCIIRNIQDPEHPLTLEQLGVVSRAQVLVSKGKSVAVRFTPTIPHCSMATLIGLCLRVKLMRSLPVGSKISVCIEPGTHQSEVSVNRQLADKERVCAALENKHLAGVVNRCIGNGMTGQLAAAV